MKKILFTLFLFNSFVVFAQINSESGKITFRNGDTAFRTISYFFDSPEEIIIEDSLGKTIIVSPIQIQEIMLDKGRKFVSKNFGRERDSTTILMQSIIESPAISLFTREESAAPVFFVSKNNFLYRLENNEIIVKNESGSFINHDSKFIGTLKALMADRQDITDNLDKIRLNEVEMVDVVSKYDRGNVTYFWQTKTKIKKEPFLVLLGQYSNYGSYWYGEKTVAHSFGIKAGVQYYFWKGSRHSFRFTGDYSKYNLESTSSLPYDRIVVYNTASIGSTYEYDFIKTNWYSVFFLLHLADLTYYTEKDNDDNSVDKGFYFIPRFSPGAGAEFQVFPRLRLYAELNNLLRIDLLPSSFSLGLKLDLINKGK